MMSRFTSVHQSLLCCGASMAVPAATELVVLYAGNRDDVRPLEYSTTQVLN